MNRSSTDFESVALGLNPLITLTFIVCINVLYQCFFFKISKNIPMNVEHLFEILTEAQFVPTLIYSKLSNQLSTTNTPKIIFKGL